MSVELPFRAVQLGERDLARPRRQSLDPCDPVGADHADVFDAVGVDHTVVCAADRLARFIDELELDPVGPVGCGRGGWGRATARGARAAPRAGPARPGPLPAGPALPVDGVGPDRARLLLASRLLSSTCCFGVSAPGAPSSPEPDP